MVLNDVFDFDVDARERPERPLPSGKISLALAKSIGAGMLFAGVILGILAGSAAAIPGAIPWRSGVIAVVLAICVVIYDVGAKRTLLGPFVMGSCRFLNVLLGMSIAAPADAPLVFGYGLPHLLVAGGIGVYIVGVTWFARGEAGTSNRAQLAFGITLMVAGMALLAVFPSYWPERRFFFDGTREIAWPLLIALLGVTIVRRCGSAMLSPSPTMVQTAVKQCIFSLVFFDAAVALQVSSPVYALSILLLLLPMLLLAQWVYST
jgi:4-hydroxybenzoate polyprenyltransferase